MCTCVGMWNWACIKRGCRLACMTVHVAICACVLGGKYECVHVFNMSVPVCALGGILGWVMKVWPLKPNQPPGPRLEHSLVSYPILHLGVNGINPNPVYRHP